MSSNQITDEEIQEAVGEALTEEAKKALAKLKDAKPAPKLIPHPQDCLVKLTAARMVVGDIAPWLLEGVVGLVPRCMQNYGTLGVTKDMLLVYDPDIVRRVDARTLATILVHEVMHILREHHPRAEQVGALTKLNAQVWNIAADACINDNIKEMENYRFPTFRDMGTTEKNRKEQKVPDSVSLDDECVVLSSNMFEHSPDIPKLDLEPGKTTEEYYYKILEHLRKHQPETEKTIEQLVEEIVQGVMAGDCGSASGNPQDGEPSADGQGSQSSGARSEADVDDIRKRVAQAIKEAMNGSGAGSVPAGWDRWADAFMKAPAVSWKSLLRQKIKRAYQWAAGQAESHYGMPSRRQACFASMGHRAPRLPVFRAPKPVIAVVIDTSGSMGTDELNRAATEVHSVLQTVRGKIQLMSNDCEAEAAVTEVRNVKEALKHFKGGGGTDFRPAIDLLSKRKKGQKPQVCIYITDGCGPAPAYKPDFHMVWVLVGTHKQKPWKAPAEDAHGWNEEHGPVDYGQFVWVNEEGTNAERED